MAGIQHYLRDLFTSLPSSPRKLRSRTLATLITPNDEYEVTVRNDRNHHQPGFLLTFYPKSASSSSVGYVTCYYTPASTKLRGLYVSPLFRGRSLGNIMLSFWVELSRHIHVDASMVLLTGVMRKPLLCKMLTSAGFTNIGGQSVTLVREQTPSTSDPDTVFVVGEGVESLLSHNYRKSQNISIQPSEPYMVVAQVALNCAYEQLLSTTPPNPLLEIKWTAPVTRTLPPTPLESTFTPGDVYTKIAATILAGVGTNTRHDWYSGRSGRRKRLHNEVRAISH